MGHVYILGAGPTGLALAQQLAESSSGTPIKVIERGTAVGGLAQTITWDSHGQHDLGPHKIFTTDPELWRRIRSLLPADEWITRPKISRIYLAGNFLPYPPSPFSLAKIFGFGAFVKMTCGFAAAKFRRHAEDQQTFESDLRGRVGDTLYSLLFRPIALKLWGDPRTLDGKLSRGRVQTPAISEVILRVLRLKKNSQFEALEFDYPRGGLSRLWNAIQNKVQHRVSFLTRTELRKIRFCDGRVQQLSWSRDGEEVTVDLAPDDFVFSTLPLAQLVKIADGVPLAISAATHEVVKLNDLILIFFKLDIEELFRDSWIFVPDPEICFHRVSEQKSFDPAMTAGGTIVCCEMMSNDVRPMSQKTDPELQALAENHLRQVALKPFRVLASKVIRLPASYPVYIAGFEPKLNTIIRWFDALENFRSIGRAGAFNYIGTLDCMDIGYGAGRWFQGKDNAGSEQRWAAERERTNHYPVLD